MNEFDIGKTFSRKLDGLVETVLATVAHVNNLDDNRPQSLVEEIRRCQLRLELGRTGNHET